MKDYCIVSGGEIDEVEEVVREKLKEGYEPQGGLLIDKEEWEVERKGYTEREVTFYQAMYRKTEGEN